MPDGRTGKYMLWRAHERFGVLPPGIRGDDTNCDWQQAELLSYQQIRFIEEAEQLAIMAGAKI